MVGMLIQKIRLGHCRLGTLVILVVVMLKRIVQEVVAGPWYYGVRNALGGGLMVVRYASYSGSGLVSAERRMERVCGR